MSKIFKSRGEEVFTDRTTVQRFQYLDLKRNFKFETNLYPSTNIDFRKFYQNLGYINTEGSKFEPPTE